MIISCKNHNILYKSEIYPIKDHTSGTQYRPMRLLVFNYEKLMYNCIHNRA